MLVGVTSEIGLHVCSSWRENVTHLAEATSAFMQSPQNGCWKLLSGKLLKLAANRKSQQKRYSGGERRLL